MSEPLDMYDLETAARTVYGEARGEPQDGRVAVARVMINRWRAGQKSLEAVCKAPKQFSCWNPDDPNEPKVRAIDWNDKVFRECAQAVLAALNLTIETDPTHGSRHYHTKAIQPWWATGRTPAATIGNHVFYSDVP